MSERQRLAERCNELLDVTSGAIIGCIIGGWISLLTLIAIEYIKRT